MTWLSGGEYLVVVTETLDQGQWMDPEFLRSSVERATRVTVLDGKKKTVNLVIRLQIQ